MLRNITVKYLEYLMKQQKLLFHVDGMEIYVNCKTL